MNTNGAIWTNAMVSHLYVDLKKRGMTPERFAKVTEGIDDALTRDVTARLLELDRQTKAQIKRFDDRGWEYRYDNDGAHHS